MAKYLFSLYYQNSITGTSTPSVTGTSPSQTVPSSTGYVTYPTAASSMSTPYIETSTSGKY